jgi:hypothetical protein
MRKASRHASHNVDLSRLDVDDLGDERTSPVSTAQQTRHTASAPGDWWASLFMLYAGVGLVVGWIAAVITLIAVYVAAVASVGWVIGIALGWIPAGIAAAIVGWLVGVLWPLLALGIAFAVYKLATA